MARGVIAPSILLSTFPRAHLLSSSRTRTSLFLRHAPLPQSGVPFLRHAPLPPSGVFTAFLRALLTPNRGVFLRLYAFLLRPRSLFYTHRTLFFYVSRVFLHQSYALILIFAPRAIFTPLRAHSFIIHMRFFYVFTRALLHSSRAIFEPPYTSP